MKYLFGLVLISILFFNFSRQNTINKELKNESKEVKINNYLNPEGINQTKAKAKIEKNNFLQLSVIKPKKARRKTKHKKAERKTKPKIAERKTKPKKSGRKTRIVEKLKLGKYIVVSLSNGDLSKNVKKLMAYVTYSKCKRKTGFLNYLQNRPTIKNNEITIYPIYVTLNQYTLSLFYSYESTTLFKIVKLNSILRVALQYDKTYCFDIIINEVEEKRLKTGPLSLCANNINEMKEWIRAILEFKECKIIKNRRHSSIPHQGKTLIDFNKINTLIKKNDKRTTSVNQITYNGNESIIQNNPEKEKQRKIISQQIDKIIHTLHMTKIYKNQLRRRLVSQFRRTRGKTKGVYHTQKLLRSMLLKKTVAEKKQYAKMIKKLNAKRTTSIMKNITDKIVKMSVMNMLI